MEKEAVIYEYGAMSSRFSLSATNKLTAYATMLAHYSNSPHLVVIYSPKEAKSDSWLNIGGKISERLDDIFGGKGSVDKYFEEHVAEIRECYKTVKRLT